MGKGQERFDLRRFQNFRRIRRDEVGSLPPDDLVTEPAEGASDTLKELKNSCQIILAGQDGSGSKRFRGACLILEELFWSYERNSFNRFTGKASSFDSWAQSAPLVRRFALNNGNAEKTERCLEGVRLEYYPRFRREAFGRFIRIALNSKGIHDILTKGLSIAGLNVRQAIQQTATYPV